MKTNYLQRSRTKGNRESVKKIAAVMLVLVAGAGFFSLFSGTLSLTFSPIWKGRDMMARGASNTLSWFKSKDFLIRENTGLRERLSSQEAELMNLRAAGDREAELLEKLGRPGASVGILSSVLVRPPETPYDILVIDAGSRDGVSVGREVSMPEGPLLGTVIEISPDTSKVRLYSSDGERTSAVLERHSVPVILTGRGGGNFRLTLPRDVEVEEGDRILSAGIGFELLAIVGTVKMSPTDSFKEVLARGAVNIFTLRYVLLK